MTTRRKTRKNGAKPVAKPPKDAKPEKRGRGRPYAIQDEAAAIAIIEGLGQIQATKAEVAAVLNIDIDTLGAFLERVPAAKSAYECGKETGKASLRRDQFALAKKNSTMAIFLGMNYLDQEDRRNMQHGGRIQHEHGVVGSLLDDVDATIRADENRHRMIDLTPNKGER